MRVFVAGATGVLGRRVVAECTGRGHEVVGLTRDDRGDRVVREAGGDPRRGDVFDRASLVDAAEGADAVVHAATAIPTDVNPDEEDWALNDGIRREGTENLVAAADAAGADRFLMQSVAWVARRPDGREFDETADPNPDRGTRSALDAERIVEDAADEAGFDPVVLRGGYFYAHDTVHTRMFGERVLARRNPIIARGLLGREDARLSFLHADDAGSAFAAAVEGDAAGTFHVVDDQPATYAAFLRGFADRLGAPDPFRIPAWLARLFVDDTLVSLLTCPMPTSNDRFRAAFDWSPAYPTIEEGLDRVVANWEATGAIRRSGDGYEWVGAVEGAVEDGGEWMVEDDEGDEEVERRDVEADG